ncbi:dienelactone hydrolase family protein [Alicyclobacillus curvatus]|jgi:carboxymethylenebutenolidase|nr:dienelactone hydrolase family protein [Alicyclobacillus curvatus]
MPLNTGFIRYGQDEEYIGYVARPEKVNKALPAVIVFQEIWGVDDHIQDVTRRFGEAGYVAFAPDLYARNGERVQGLGAERIIAVKNFLENMPPTAWHDAAERDKALAELPGNQGQLVGETFSRLFGGLDMDNYTHQLLATTQFLSQEFEASKGQKIGSVGFCMGGALSAHLAGHYQALAGAVMFYGRAPKPEVLEKIACPVRGFFGDLDVQLTSTIPAFAEAMKAAGKDFEYTVYEGAHHAFFNDTRRSYNVDASRDAFTKTLDFFNIRLK